MNTLHLQGYVVKDYDNVISLINKYNAEKNSFDRFHAKSIPQSVEDFADEHGVVKDYNGHGLGGAESLIENVSLRIYATDKECSLEDAQDCLIRKVFGDIETQLSLIGYSEYTITGVVLDEFSIGGHDLEKEIESYYGKYIHFILEV